MANTLIRLRKDPYFNLYRERRMDTFRVMKMTRNRNFLSNSIRTSIRPNTSSISITIPKKLELPPKCLDGMKGFPLRVARNSYLNRLFMPKSTLRNTCKVTGLSKLRIRGVKAIKTDTIPKASPILQTVIDTRHNSSIERGERFRKTLFLIKKKRIIEEAMEKFRSRNDKNIEYNKKTITKTFYYGVDITIRKSIEIVILKLHLSMSKSD